MHKNHGFTMLEVLVVVGVAVIIAAVATPGFMAWRANSQLSGVTEQFRGDLQLAKARAVRDAQTVIVKLKADQYRVFVDAGNGSSGGPPNGRYDPTETIICDRQLPGGIQIKFSSPAVSDPGGQEDHFPSAAGGDKTSGVIPPGEGRGGGRIGGLMSGPSGAGDTASGSEPSATETGIPQTPGNGNDIRFDRSGRCLNPQNFVFDNFKGKQKLVAVNLAGSVRVIKMK